MNIAITYHARGRMADRGVTEEEVINCLKCPDAIVPGKENSQTAQQRLNGKMIRVIFIVHSNAMVVLTVYKTEAKRYEI